MKRFILLICFSIVTSSLWAQIHAITESGDEVILYQNRTWDYVADTMKMDQEAKLNPKKFKKPKASTFLVKSKKVNIGIWINPKQWSFTGKSKNEYAEYQFRMKDEEAYGILISEEVQIPIENLKIIALKNAKSAASDARLTHEEFRIVNGNKILMMEIKGTIQGIPFVYHNYYYSNESGTIQLISFTSQNQLDKYEDGMEDLLNGLVTLKED